MDLFHINIEEIEGKINALKSILTTTPTLVYAGSTMNFSDCRGTCMGGCSGSCIASCSTTCTGVQTY